MEAHTQKKERTPAISVAASAFYCVVQGCALGLLFFLLHGRGLPAWTVNGIQRG